MCVFVWVFVFVCWMAAVNKRKMFKNKIFNASLKAKTLTNVCGVSVVCVCVCVCVLYACLSVFMR